MAFLRDKSVFCIPNATLSMDERYVIGGICMGTSSIGFLGAALQLKSLWQYRDRQRRRPSANPRIIFYLAWSDLVACLGIFVLAMCLMFFELPILTGDHYTPPHDALYASVGTTVEVFTLFAYLASYIWTFAYVLDMCFQIYRVECSMVVYHILAWLIPLEIVTCIEVVNYVEFPSYCQGYHGRISRLILSYFPVTAIMIVNPILFLVTYRKVRQQLRSSGRFTFEDRNALNTCKKKFFWMIFSFTVCWFPNIISVSYDLVTVSPTQVTKSKLDNLWFLEAFVNPLQGIFNYFVYRHSFKVSATDTKSARKSLPRVSKKLLQRQYGSRQHYSQKVLPTKGKQTVQRSEGSPTTADEETQLLGSSRSTDTSSYSYVSRLLGE